MSQKQQRRKMEKLEEPEDQETCCKILKSVFKLTATIMKSHCHETSKIWLPKQDINNDST